MPTPLLLLTLVAVLPFSSELIAAPSPMEQATPAVRTASSDPLLSLRLAQSDRPPAAQDDDEDQDEQVQPGDQNQDQNQDDSDGGYQDDDKGDDQGQSGDKD